MTEAIRETLKYSNFLKELVKRDFKKKYYKSVLGVLWTVLNPLLMMLVITFIFSTLFKRNIEYFPIYFLCGFLVFGFNTEATNTSLHAIIDNSALVKKIYIPTYLFCISKTCLALITKLLSLIPLFLVMIVLRVPFHSTILLVPLLWIPLFLFSFGLGLALASMAVYFRDMFHLYGVVIQLWTYLTPIFYPVEIIPEQFRVLWNFNPMFHYVGIMRDLVLYGTLPSFLTVLYAVSYAVLALGIGITLYSNLEKNFILHF